MRYIIIERRNISEFENRENNKKQRLFYLNKKMYTRDLIQNGGSAGKI